MDSVLRLEHVHLITFLDHPRSDGYLLPIVVEVVLVVFFVVLGLLGHQQAGRIHIHICNL